MEGSVQGSTSHEGGAGVLEDVLEVYGIVYATLTDPSKDMEWDERCARAANEIAAANGRLVAWLDAPTPALDWKAWAAPMDTIGEGDGSDV
jgi:hypothetical protein